MVPTDRRFTNATVDDILVVRELLVAPNIQTRDLVVTGSASIRSIVSLNDLEALSISTLNTGTINASKGFFSDFADQLVLGTGNTITMNAPTPTFSHTYTIPDVGADASFVMTEGAQTINGVKTFSDTPIFLDGFSLLTLTLGALANQLILGTGNTITLNAPTPTVSHIYTIPDVSVDSDFVMTEGLQTINGVKVFMSMAVFVMGFAAASMTLTNVTNQITMGSGQTVTINAPTPLANRVYTTPDVGADASFIMSEGAQTLNGVKTFSATAVFLTGFSAVSITLTGVSNQIIMGTGNTITLNAPTPAASRTYTTPDVGANASFIMSEGTQTINGAKTFSTQVAINPTTNQLILGTGTTITVHAPTPAADRTYTMPDVLANASFVMTAGTQTVGGAKTFSSAITDSAVTNQIVLGAATTIILNAPAPAVSRVYTIPDVSANASFVMTEGAQTINGVKTFTSAPVFPALTFTNITLTDVTNQIIMGTGNTITLNAPTPAASRIYTTPDVGANASFLLSEGAQTINGTKTFSVAIVDSALTNQLVLGAATTITVNAPAPAVSRIYTMPDVLANASFVMTAGTQTIGGAKTFSVALTDSALTNQIVLGGATTITVNAPAPAASRVYTIPDVLANANFIMSEGNQTINGTKTFTSSPIFPGSTFANITLTDVTNQITMGTGNTIIVNAPTPAATRTYTMPDVLSNASFVMTEGAQTINGTKTFSVAIVDSAATNQLVLGSATTITVNAPAPAASRVYTMSDVLTNASFVMTEGTQTINGSKTWTSPISDTALTNQVVLGAATTITLNAPAPAASRVYTMPDVLANASFVMTEGNQTINGSKTFSVSLTDAALVNQLILGAATTITVNAPAPAASRVYTMPDVLANASFVMTEGTQTINGTKTFAATLLAHTASNVGGDVTTSTTNTDNTNGASNSVLSVTTGGASGGDPKVTFSTGVTSYAEGIDNSDSDAFVRSVGTALGTTNYERVDTSGRITYPTQPLFISYKTTESTNATGAGVDFTVIFDTEVKDVGGVYNNATGTFTAPVTGVYWLEANVIVRAITSAMVNGFLKFRLNPGSIDRLTIQTNTANLRDGANTTTLFMGRTISLTANDTINVRVNLGAGAGNTATIGGDANQTSYFSGRLIG